MVSLASETHIPFVLSGIIHRKIKLGSCFFNQRLSSFRNPVDAACYDEHPEDDHDESHEVYLPAKKQGQAPNNDKQADDYAHDCPAVRKTETLIPDLRQATSNLQQAKPT
jgi:hypothetical protein